MLSNLVPQFLWVALGGAVGASGRFAAWLLFQTRGGGFPWATFSVNMLGSLLIGAVMMLTLDQAPTSRTRLLVVTGILGGFTTFSAFSFELGEMVTQRRFGDAALYAGASVMLGLGAMLLGALLARAVLR